MTLPFRRGSGFAGATIALLAAAPLRAAEAPRSLAEYRARIAAERASYPPVAPETPLHLVECVDGMAGIYPCSNVDLLEFLTLASFAFGGPTPFPAPDNSNSLWGWTDPVTSKEYALLGLDNGTAFVDVTDPANTIYVGALPSHLSTSLWRDVRVYQNYAYVVADAIPHGLQVFDLTQLRNVTTPPVRFTETAFYGQVGNVHTLSINEETGRAVLVGSDTCSGGLHIVSLANPASPQFAGCYDDGGYVHENQCFTYHGPDTAYAGHDICLASRGSAESIDIIDITNPANPVRLDSFRYQPAGVSSYSHQAWFTEDHRYILLNDEFDESDLGHNTKTWIFDAADLDNVGFAGPGSYTHATPAIDHNEYVHGNWVFQSNYTAGVRILELTDPAQAQLTEIGFFDLFPAHDSPQYSGSWNNYFFPASGTLIATHIEQGLFVLRPTSLCEAPGAPTGLTATPNGDNRIDLSWAGSGIPGNTFDVERALGGCAGSFETIADGLAAPAYSDTTASGTVTYGYRVRERDASGFCVSEPATCVEASTTGACTAPPLFAGLASAANSGDSACRIDLDWAAASPYCGGPPTYSVYRSTAPDFVPAAANRIAEGVVATDFADLTPPPLETVYYVVRAVDGANDVEDGNLVHRSARATGPVGDGTFTTGAEVGDFPFDTGDGPESPEHAGWHISSARHHTGARSFWSTSSSNLCVTLEGDITLTAGQSPQLDFRTLWEIETGWDGGVLDISTDGGSTWTRLTPAGGYPGTIQNSGNACQWTVGTPVFTGLTPGFPAFQAKTVDLGAYDGQTVRLRWRYGSDSSVNDEGWYVDDIAITHAQVPSACTSAALLIADFEEGDTSEWSSTVP